jgi:hypothetical protein
MDFTNYLSFFVNMLQEKNKLHIEYILKVSLLILNLGRYFECLIRIQIYQSFVMFILQHEMMFIRPLTSYMFFLHIFLSRWLSSLYDCYLG